jgi:hypothetical protein
MRKLVTIILCFISVTTFAQLKLGIEAGYNVSQFTSKGGNSQFFFLSNLNTFQAGLVGEEKLNKHFFLQAGVSFTQKGSVKDATQYAVGGGPSTIVKLNYIQIPVNMFYKIKLNSSLKALLGAGLYGAFGISGSDKGTSIDATTGSESQVNNKVRFQNNTIYVAGITYIKPFDIGYNLVAGLEWKNLQFKATINDGFKNIYPSGDTEFRNQVFSATVAYLLPWN